MAWYNITCRSGGLQVNAGATDGTGECDVSPLFTFTNGAWNDGTSVYTCSGAPDLSTVTVGHRIALAFDGETTLVANHCLNGYITAVDNTAKTITIGGKVAILGTVSTVASGVTARIGGALLGPSSAGGFPLGTALNSLSSNPTRINLKNDQVYSVTSGVTMSLTSTRIQGYTTTFGDGGKFILDGGVAGASYTLLTVSGNNTELYDAEIRNNGATGNSAGLIVSGVLCDLFRVTVHDVRGVGISQASNRVVLTECLTYACNQSNTANTGAFSAGSNVPVMWVRCVARDNTGSNARGWYLGTGALLVLKDCIADSNGNAGVELPTQSIPTVLTGCDFYANGGSGIVSAFSTTTILKNFFVTDCNFVANSAYGINLINNNDGNKVGRIQNCGFGSGTAANTSGATNALGDTVVSGSVTYDANATPWTDPAAGDFTVALTAAKGTGTGLAFSPTVSYPDRAAAQGAAA